MPPMALLPIVLPDQCFEWRRGLKFVWEWSMLVRGSRIRLHASTMEVVE
jgi:hypothetical protein